MENVLLIVMAGLVAGAMNALAGGGSFVSLPVLIALGVPSVAANVSSTIALYPGGLASAWVYWNGPEPVGRIPLTTMAAVTLAGGLVGSAVLLSTPSSLFDHVLPWLLLLATVALALGPRLSGAVHRRVQRGVSILLTGQFLLGIYGGYFGGAVGIMMMAFWSVTVGADLKSLQAPRTALVTVANTAAVVYFALAGAVQWNTVALMAPAAVAGGYAGALVGRKLRPAHIRFATIALASLVTCMFFVRAYG